MEHCSLPLGLDQGIVEDEDVSVEADAGVDESVDKSEEEDNESDEAEVVVGVYLRSGGANHVDYSKHAVCDDDPVEECSGCLLHDEDDEGDIGDQDQEGGGDPGCYPHPVTITSTVITIVRPSIVCCA